MHKCTQNLAVSNLTIVANRNEHRQLGSYTEINAHGSTSIYAATDVWLKTSPMDGIAINQNSISNDIAQLPGIRG